MGLVISEVGPVNRSDKRLADAEPPEGVGPVGLDFRRKPGAPVACRRFLIRVRVRIGSSARRIAKRHLERHSQEGVHIEQARNVQGVAAITAARRDPHDELQVKGGYFQSRAQQIIGEDKGGLAAFMVGQIIPPGLGDTDDDFETRIYLADYVRQPHREPQEFLVGQGEHPRPVAGGRDLPGADDAPVALHRPGHEIGKIAANAGQVGLLFPEPMRQTAAGEVGQGTADDR